MPFPMSALAPAPVSSRPLAGLRILLAEDSAVTRRMCETALRAAGAAVDAAADGLSAFRTWESAALTDRPIDIAVVDFGMPYLNGAALTAMLRAAGFGGTIVGMTASVDEAEESLWRGCGCEAVLPKGLPGREFAARVAEFRPVG